MTSISNPLSGAAFQAPKLSTGNEITSSFLDFRSVMAEQYEQWREMPEEERIRHTYLEKHGLTEIGLDNLSAKDRAAHEEKIASLSNTPVLSTFPFSGSKAGDSLTRAVITLQSVLETSETDPSAPVSRTASSGKD